VAGPTSTCRGPLLVVFMTCKEFYMSFGSSKCFSGLFLLYCRENFSILIEFQILCLHSAQNHRVCEFVILGGKELNQNNNNYMFVQLLLVTSITITHVYYKFSLGLPVHRSRLTPVTTCCGVSASPG
jgi:hypothetical protein